MKNGSRQEEKPNENFRDGFHHPGDNQEVFCRSLFPYTHHLFGNRRQFLPVDLAPRLFVFLTLSFFGLSPVSALACGAGLGGVFELRPLGGLNSCYNHATT